MEARPTATHDIAPEDVILLAHFDIVHPDNRVEYDFWYSSADTHALSFLVSLKTFQEKLGEDALFTPRFKTQSCFGPCEEDQCLGSAN